MAAKTLDEQLCFSIYSAGLAINRLYKPLLDRLSLTYPQYLALCVLWEHGEQTVGSIAEKLSLETSTLTPLLKRLEAGDLITRIRSREDERQVVIALTDKGDKLRIVAQCLPEAFFEGSGLDLVEIVALNEQIKLLRDNFSRIVGGR